MKRTIKFKRMDNENISILDNNIEKDKSLFSLTKNPFDNIGLAFSGGGFRAASFSLGTLSYLQNLFLDDKPLLHKVSYISSASGGTITNASYALSITEKKEFGTFYKELFENIEGNKILARAFDNLNDAKVWKDYPHKRRNIINAFALAYDQLLFKEKTLNEINQKGTEGHLDEVCFNTTEFYRGLVFRQAFKLKKDGGQDGTFKYGNNIIHLQNGAQSVLKLSDILAASSCFPAGFEPILFPGDFNYRNKEVDVKKHLLENLCIELQEMQWEELSRLYNEKDIIAILKNTPSPIDVKALSDKLKKLPLKDDLNIGFMDGGITDNQGIESIMKANERRIKKDTDFKEFDLMLICDVGSQYMDPYIPIKARVYNKLSINWLIFISIIMALVGIALIVFLSKIFIIVGSILSFLSVCFNVSIYSLKKFIGKKLEDGKGLNLSKTFSPEIVKKLFQHFGSTPIGAIIDMLKERFNSVITLNSDVFLKRVRQLLFRRFMDEGRKSFRMKTNHIYDLSFSNDLNRFRDKDPQNYGPSKSMQIVAEHAFEMGTTLWFEKENILNTSQACIIACGQFTACYNLLVYIWRMKIPLKDDASYFTNLSIEWQKKINSLECQLSKDYETFKNDPFWLYNHVGSIYKIDEFKPYNINELSFPNKFLNLR